MSMPAVTPGRGVDRAVAHEDRVGVELDLRIAAPEEPHAEPVRRGAAAVEQAGLGEDEGAAAHRGEPAQARDQDVRSHGGARRVGRPSGRRRRRDDQRVDAVAHLRVGPVGDEAQARGHAHRTRRSARTSRRTAPAGRAGAALDRLREDLERAGDVERLRPVEDQERDGARPGGGIRREGRDNGTRGA